MVDRTLCSWSRLTGIVILLVGWWLSATSGLAQTPRPIKALLVTGGCCHEYPRQIEIITRGISQRANVEWDVVQGGSEREDKLPLYDRPDWAQGYDVVVHNECYGSVTDVEYVHNIVNAHKNGGVAAVVIHCSMHSYRNADTEEWRNLLGVASRQHEKQRPVEVKTLDREHPIMHGFPGVWNTPQGELYMILARGANCKLLAQAYGVDSQKNHACVWTNTYGKARLFGTTIGHHNETMLTPEWLGLVSRGLLWACGKLRDDGQPTANFEGTGIVASAIDPVEPEGPVPTEADWAASLRFPPGEKPIKLFNGRDLSGWEGQIGAYFNVHDGIIVAKNDANDAPDASTYLVTEKLYRNFRLVFEGKLVESKMHSGIALWGETVTKAGDPYSCQGHLVMFPENWGFWDLYRRNSIYKDDGRAQKADKVGDWNRMEILAVGARIRLAVNGQFVADWTDPQPEYCRAGPIGLQLHSNRVAQEVHFRGLILSEDPEDRMITVVQQAP